MYLSIEPTLYIDEQTKPHLPCRRCGGACYAPGYRCLRCERRAP